MRLRGIAQHCPGSQRKVRNRTQKPRISPTDIPGSRDQRWEAISRETAGKLQKSLLPKLVVNLPDAIDEGLAIDTAVTLHTRLDDNF